VRALSAETVQFACLQARHFPRFIEPALHLAIEARAVLAALEEPAISGDETHNAFATVFVPS
jgi:hypothetical protein